jgi:hypothetical protein
LAGDNLLLGNTPAFAEVFVEPATGLHDLSEPAKLVAVDGDSPHPTPSPDSFPVGSSLALSGDMIAIAEGIGAVGLSCATLRDGLRTLAPQGA